MYKQTIRLDIRLQIGYNDHSLIKQKKSMNPNYHQFIVAALRESTGRYSINNVLANAFMMWNEGECNEAIQGIVDSYAPDVIGECFHKTFRQIDMTDNGYLDSIIWYSMHERTNMHKIIKFIAENQSDFNVKSIERLVDDYGWDD